MSTPEPASHDQRRRIRARMAATGENYTTARRALTAPKPGRCTACRIENPNLTRHESVDGVTVAGRYCPDCAPLRSSELGGAALGSGAGAAERARAEALWRPVADPDQPCRCSGRCQHGAVCTDYCGESDCAACDSEDGPLGRLIHVDRYPGALLFLEAWADEYVCTHCGSNGDHSPIWHDVPGLPWGEPTHDEQGQFTGNRVYVHVRHPNFPDTHPGYNPDDPDDDDEEDEGLFAEPDFDDGYGFDCSECGDEEWVLDQDDSYTPCPSCRPEHAITYQRQSAPPA